MRALPCKLGRPVSNAAIERHLHLACIDTQTVEIERGIAAHRHPATHADGCAGEVGQRRIGNRGNARIEIGREPPR